MKLEPTQKCFAINAKKLGTWLETAKIQKKQDLTLEEVVLIDLLGAHLEDLEKELEDLGNQNVWFWVKQYAFRSQEVCRRKL